MTKEQHEQLAGILRKSGVKLDITEIRSNAYKGGKEAIGIMVKIPHGARYRVDYIQLEAPKPEPKVEPKVELKKGKRGAL